MLVYTGVKEDFMADVDLDLIAEKIQEKYQPFFGTAHKAEVNSWKNSMQYMYKVLNDDEIPSNSGIAIEFNIPSTSKRVDFIVTGYDENNKEGVIVIELKQWEICKAIMYKDGLVSTFVAGGEREVTHPSYQAMSYANLIRDFNKTVQDEMIDIYPCAYLHNYILTDDDPINNEHYKEYIEEAPLFGRGDVVKLREFIKKYIKEGDNKELLYKIENGKIAPSKRLQDALSGMLQGNKEFLMIDEQKLIYEESLMLAKKSKEDNQKRVLIVEGGPGTGKTVVAMNLLVELTNNGMVCNYTTKNSAPREVFYTKLKGDFKANYIKNLFKPSGTYTNTLPDTFDCIIVDEAHRLNEKSGIFQHLGENQIKEIINSSRFSIFFIDESQKVTINDFGSLEEIIKQSEYLGAEYKVMQLESQFRCNGSSEYLAWLDHTLQIRETANFIFDFDYDFKVFNNPNDLRDAIFEKNKIKNKSRLVAGYCWNWPKKDRNNSEYHDIDIEEHDFKMSWNLDGGELFAIGEETVNQVGCIHTTQGLEFDYVGVIIGDDLRFEDGILITDFTKRASTDQSLKGIKTMHKSDPDKAFKLADEIIKNTYRTLMTRGIKGCYIYCTDKNLNEYFKERL